MKDVLKMFYEGYKLESFEPDYVKSSVGIENAPFYRFKKVGFDEKGQETITWSMVSNKEFHSMMEFWRENGLLDTAERFNSVILDEITNFLGSKISVEAKA